MIGLQWVSIRGIGHSNISTAAVLYWYPFFSLCFYLTEGSVAKFPLIMVYGYVNSVEKNVLHGTRNTKTRGSLSTYSHYSFTIKDSEQQSHKLVDTWTIIIDAAGWGNVSLYITTSPVTIMIGHWSRRWWPIAHMPVSVNHWKAAISQWYN